MENEFITIKKDKNGEWDFSVSGAIGSLSIDEIEKMRSMTITAIYIAEDMWHREQNNKPENQACSNLKV